MLTAPNEYSLLERYGRNLTTLARQGVFSPLPSQEATVSRLFQILLRTNTCNPVLLDFDETRRWAVIKEMIRRMAVGDAPDPLPKQQAIVLDYQALFADLSDDVVSSREVKSSSLDSLVQAQPGSEERVFQDKLSLQSSSPERETPTARLVSIFNAMQQTPDSFLLVVDHFHRIVGGEWNHDPIDVTPLLMPLLARRQIQLIGACTLEQYREYIEENAALQRRFQEVLSPEVRQQYQ